MSATVLFLLPESNVHWSFQFVRILDFVFVSECFAERVNNRRECGDHLNSRRCHWLLLCHCYSFILDLGFPPFFRMSRILSVAVHSLFLTTGDRSAPARTSLFSRR